MTEDAQRRFFERLAHRYDNRFLRARWPRNQELKAHAVADALGPSMLDGRLVEVGCGTGQIAELLLDAWPKMGYLGLDLSEAMLGVARHRLARFGARVELRTVNPGGVLPLKLGEADGVFGVDVLHHLDQPAETLGEIRRALPPGAPVVFLEANPRFPLTAAIGLVQPEERGVLRIGLRSLSQWLAAAGFTEIDVRYGRIYTPPGPRRLEPALAALDAAAARLPGVRALAIYVEARGRVPEVGSIDP